jgi:hypothetical protein
MHIAGVCTCSEHTHTQIYTYIYIYMHVAGICTCSDGPNCAGGGSSRSAHVGLTPLRYGPVGCQVRSMYTYVCVCVCMFGRRGVRGFVCVYTYNMHTYIQYDRICWELKWTENVCVCVCVCKCIYEYMYVCVYVCISYILRLVLAWRLRP